MAKTLYRVVPAGGHSFSVDYYKATDQEIIEAALDLLGIDTRDLREAITDLTTVDSMMNDQTVNALNRIIVAINALHEGNKKEIERKEKLDPEDD